MSGPKTSRYTLTPEMRQILAEQRRLERRKTIASESIRRSKKRFLELRTPLSAEKQISEEYQRRTGSDEGFFGVLQNLEEAIAFAESLSIKTNIDDVTVLEKNAASVSEYRKKAESLAKELSVIAARNEAKLRKILSKDIDQGFSTSFEDIKPTPIETIKDDKNAMITDLAQMKNNPVLPDSFKSEILAVIKKINDIEQREFLVNYNALTINPLLKKCQMYIEEYEACHDEFEVLYCEYIGICDMYGYVAQEYVCSLASINKLRDEIKRIKDEVAEADEQAYIRDCLDEAMEEMGYSVIGSRDVTKNNGKHFTNELYLFSEGTAVNITYSSDGKIAMELGGLDSVDRLPYDSESSSLCDSMYDFCSVFKEIEGRLLKKGVVLANRISLLPPSVEYAQIINTTDYQMTIDEDKMRKNKRHRAGKKQAMLRRENRDG